MNINNKLLAISIIVTMHAVSGFTFFEIYANRTFILLVSVSFSVIFGIQYLRLGIKKLAIYQILLLLSFLVFMLFHFYDISYIIDVMMSLFIVAIISSADVRLTNKILIYLIGLTVILSIMGLILFIISITLPDLNYSVLDNSRTTHPLRFLGGIQPGYDIGNYNIPRSQSFLKEPSLLPAYMGIPFAFLLAMEKKYLAKIIVLIFLLISSAGSVYFVFILAFLSYLMMKNLSRKYFLLLFLILCIPIYFYYLIFHVTTFEPQKSDSDMIFSQVMESTKESTSEIYLQHRAVSSVIRIGTISWSLQAALHHPIGMSFPLSVVNGLLIYSFVTSGIIGLFLCILYYGQILNKTYLLFSVNKFNLRIRTAAALIAGLCIEAFMFNDYGFTSVHGMPLLALALKKIVSITKQSQEIS